MTSMLSTLTLFLAQTDTDVTTNVSPAAAAGGAAGGFIGLAVAVVMIVSMWKIFTKAGQPGWAAIIPIFNIYILCKVAGRPGWWVLLMLIPFVNFIIAIILLIDLAKAFGKGVGFGLGLLFLGIIFFPILAFGSAQYVGRPAAPATV